MMTEVDINTFEIFESQEERQSSDFMSSVRGFMSNCSSFVHGLVYSCRSKRVAKIDKATSCSDFSTFLDGATDEMLLPCPSTNSVSDSAPHADLVTVELNDLPSFGIRKAFEDCLDSNNRYGMDEDNDYFDSRNRYEMDEDYDFLDSKTAFNKAQLYGLPTKKVYDESRKKIAKYFDLV